MPFRRAIVDVGVSTIVSEARFGWLRPFLGKLASGSTVPPPAFHATTADLRVTGLVVLLWYLPPKHGRDIDPDTAVAERLPR